VKPDGSWARADSEQGCRPERRSTTDAVPRPVGCGEFRARRAQEHFGVDGEKLVTMIEQLELGLSPIKAFKLDESFFAQFKS
jgi:hypothetical protein